MRVALVVALVLAQVTDLNLVPRADGVQSRVLVKGDTLVLRVPLKSMAFQRLRVSAWGGDRDIEGVGVDAGHVVLELDGAQGGCGRQPLQVRACAGGGGGTVQWSSEY